MTEIVPEFSRPLPVNELPVGGHPFFLEANATERAALAVRYRIPAVFLLRFEGTLAAAAARTRLSLTGRLVAEVEQVCVVTLAPVTSTIDMAVDRMFVVAPDWHDEARADEAAQDASGESLDDADWITGPVIDAGEVVAEELALALDPYPRATGASFAGYVSTGPQPGQPHPGGGGSPFAVLKSLRKEH